MGKSGRNYRERGRLRDGRPGSMRPDFEPEKFDDFMDIYRDTDHLDPLTEHYQWEDEDDI
jgi:hypothetical protein